MVDIYAGKNAKDVRSLELEFVRGLNAFVLSFRHLTSPDDDGTHHTTRSDEKDRKAGKEDWKTGAKPHAYAESLRRQLNALREKTKEMHALQQKKKKKKKRNTLLAAVFAGAHDNDEDVEDENDDDINDENDQSNERDHIKKECERKFRAYEEKINEIEKRLPTHEHPAFVSVTASAIPSSSSSSLSHSSYPSFAPTAMTTASENVDVLEPTQASTVTTQTKKKLYAPKKFTVSKEGDKILQDEKKMQENLTNEMVDLASRIKRNAEEVSKELSRSNKLVDSMETKLDQNFVVAKGATQRQTAVFRKNKKYGCWSCIVLTLVFVLFSWVYIVIKFSGDKTVKLIDKKKMYDDGDNDEKDVVQDIRVERDEVEKPKHSSSSRDALEL